MEGCGDGAGAVVSLPGFSCVAAATFHKLPNPLSGLIQQLPVVDGLDEGKLVVFLYLSLQLFDVPDILTLTCLDSYCRGPLAERVTESIRSGCC